MDSIEVMKKEIKSPKENNSKVKTNMKTKGRLEKLFAGIKQRCDVFLEEGKIDENLEWIANFLKVNPLLACSLFAVLIGVSIPIVLFVLFAVVNVAFVVAGFIILEVTIFIIGSTVLACSIFFVITTAAVIGLGVLSFYLIFYYLINSVKKCKI